MDAEKVKEIVFQTINNLILSLQNTGDFAHADWVIVLDADIKKLLEHGEAAEQESYKALPWCGATTRSIVGCGHGSSMFCKYRRAELESGEAHCSFPDDEPAEDSEPDTERDRHWQERAMYLEGQLDTAPHQEIYRRLEKVEKKATDNSRITSWTEMHVADFVEKFSDLEDRLGCYSIPDELTKLEDRVEQGDNKISSLIKGLANHMRRHAVQENEQSESIK